MPRPRGRPRAPRLSRMDAAVDAMLPYGFPEEKIKKRVKQLLKEYGGDVGWPFIEEFSYKVLLDSILEDDNDEQVLQNGNLLEGKSCVDEAIEEAAAPIAVADDGVLHQLPPPPPPSPPPSSPPPSGDSSLALPVAVEKKPRIPCYGWIESDEDDPDDFITLAKPLPMSRLATWRKKQRSRWDLKPTDP